MGILGGLSLLSLPQLFGSFGDPNDPAIAVQLPPNRRSREAQLQIDKMLARGMTEAQIAGLKPYRPLGPFGGSAANTPDPTAAPLFGPAAGPGIPHLGAGGLGGQASPIALTGSAATGSPLGPGLADQHVPNMPRLPAPPSNLGPFSGFLANQSAQAAPSPSPQPSALPAPQIGPALAAPPLGGGIAPPLRGLVAQAAPSMMAGRAAPGVPTAGAPGVTGVPWAGTGAAPPSAPISPPPAAAAAVGNPFAGFMRALFNRNHSADSNYTPPDFQLMGRG